MDLQDIVDEIARNLDAAATIEDRAFQLLAYCAQSGAIDRVRQESILRRRATDRVRDYFEGFGVATAPGPVRIPPDERLSVLGRVCVPLRHRDVTYGYLWLLDSGTITDERLAVVDPLVRRAAAALVQEARSRQDAAAGLRALLSADPDVRGAAELDVEGPVVAIAVRSTPDRVAALWTLPRGVLADPGESLTAFLSPAAQAREVAERIHALHGTATGIGAAREDPAEAWQSWREAVHAVRIAETVERHAPIAAWPELGVYRVLARMPRPELAELAAQVRDLPEELARTVETYLDHGGHVLETAQALGVHRQTLYYRLGKAERVTGLDLGDGEHRLMLHLGLKAAGLIHRKDGTEKGVTGWKHHGFTQDFTR